MTSKAPFAEAKEAEETSTTALLVSGPPNFTGREAWDQAGSLQLRGMLEISLRIEHCKVSKI